MIRYSVRVPPTIRIFAAGGVLPGPFRSDSRRYITNIIMNNRELFLQHVAQTSDAPMALEMVSAEGIYQKDVEGKTYIDLIAGFSVCNIGHSHPRVIKAVAQQIREYMHLIVYGEFIEAPQVRYAKRLCDLLPGHLNSVFFYQQWRRSRGRRHEAR